MSLKRKGVHAVIAELLIFSLVVLLGSMAANFIMESSKKGEVAIYKKGEKEIMCREGIAWKILNVDGANITIKNTGIYPIKLSQLEVYAADVISLERRGKKIKIAGWSKEILVPGEVGNVFLETDPFSLGEGYLTIEGPCGTKDIHPLYFLPVMCWIEAGSCSSGSCVFALSSLENAHLENCSAGNYQYKFCCANISDVSIFNGTCPLGYTGFLTLSSPTNAHAEEYGYSGSDGFSKKYNVCVKPISGNWVGNYTTLSNCKGMPLFSISSKTNAHIGNFAKYSTVFCYRQE